MTVLFPFDSQHSTRTITNWRKMASMAEKPQGRNAPGSGVEDAAMGGLRIPALSDIAEATVSRLGTGSVDLANTLQRQRLANALESAMSMYLQLELERALKAATERAIAHVFRTMRDADY